MKIMTTCAAFAAAALLATSTACSSSGPAAMPTTSTGSAVTSVTQVSGTPAAPTSPANVTTSPPTGTSSSPANRPTIDAATAKATFRSALAHLPADTTFAEYIDWDALGHPDDDDFFSVVDDGTNERWTNFGIPAHSEQWSLGFQTPSGAGEMLHWSNPRLVPAIVAALKRAKWSVTGTDAVPVLSWPGGDKIGTAFLFLGTQVWADTTSNTLIAYAHGHQLFATDPSHSVLSVAGYRSLVDALPQFASASLYLGTTAACTALPKRQPPPSKVFIQRYADLVAPFHTVTATAAVMSAAAIPEHIHLADPRHIASDVFIQLQSAAVAKAELDSRAAVATKVVEFVGKPSDLVVTGKQVLGAIDRYQVTGSDPVDLGQRSDGGYNVCGTAK